MSRIITRGEIFKNKGEVLALYSISKGDDRRHRYDLGKIHGDAFAGKHLSFYSLGEHVFKDCGMRSEEEKLRDTYLTTLSADGEMFTIETKDGEPRPDADKEAGKTLILFFYKGLERVFEGEFGFTRCIEDRKWIYMRALNIETKTPDLS